MKQIASITFFFTGLLLSAQVGINTTDPKGTLDIVGVANSLTTIDGVIAPRLTRAQLTAKGNTLYGTNQTGAIVYISDISGGDTVSQRSNITRIGYYYFDGASWQFMQGIDIYDSNGTIGTTRSVGVTDNVNFANNTFFIDGTNNRIGIGTNTPTVPLQVRGRILTTHSVPLGDPNSQILINGDQSQIEIQDAFANKTILNAGVASDDAGGTYLGGFKIQKGTTPQLVIWPNGNIVLGGNSAAPGPTEKLEVLGNARLTGLPSVTSTTTDKFVTVGTDGTLRSTPFIPVKIGSELSLNGTTNMSAFTPSQLADFYFVDRIHTLTLPTPSASFRGKLVRFYLFGGDPPNFIVNGVSTANMSATGTLPAGVTKPTGSNVLTITGNNMRFQFIDFICSGTEWWPNMIE